MNRAKLAEIDLTSTIYGMKPEAASSRRMAVTRGLGVAQTKISTTEKYLNVKTDDLHELNERVPLR